MEATLSDTMPGYRTTPASQWRVNTYSVLSHDQTNFFSITRLHFDYFGGAQSTGFAVLRNVPKLLLLEQDWTRKVCGFFVLFGYLTKWSRAELVRDELRDHFDFFDLFFNLFEEERTIILACLGLELTHLCSLSDQGRLLRYLHRKIFNILFWTQNLTTVSSDDVICIYGFLFRIYLRI